MKTVKAYTLAELKKKNPEAFEKLHEEWKTHVAQDQAPWANETIASLKAAIDACGGTLHRYSIGPYSPCMASVSVSDTFEEEDEEGNSCECQKDADWLFNEVLAPLGYTSNHDGTKVEFPGLCPFTGYCADDTFLEETWKAMRDGSSTLSEALESLADVAGRMMECDQKQQQEEESMLMNWGGNHYTIDGIEV